MGKQIYNYEIIGQRNKKIGGISGDYCTKEEMILKAQGMYLGTGVLRTFVGVIVRDEIGNIVHEVKNLRV